MTSTKTKHSSPLEVMAMGLALLKEGKTYTAEDLALETGTNGPRMLLHLRVLYRYGHVRVAGLVGKLGYQRAVWGIKTHPEEPDVQMANYVKARVFKIPLLNPTRVRRAGPPKPRKTPRAPIPKSSPVKLSTPERDVLRPKVIKPKPRPANSVFDLAAFHQRKKESA